MKFGSRLYLETGRRLTSRIIAAMAVNVGLVTKRLRQHNYFLMPNMLDDRNLHKKNLGKATGEELVNLVDAGQLDGATNTLSNNRMR